MKKYINKCDCYHIESEQHHFIDENGVPIYENINVPRCWGTKEKDVCDCNGDKSECSFYDSVREKAAVEKNNSDIKDVIDKVEDLIGKYWGGDPAYYTDSKNKEEADAAKLCCKILEAIRMTQGGENDEEDS